MKHIIYRWAGVDAELIETCPRFDRIWAIHIGLALFCTFVVVFTVSYFSIEYINGASVTLNPDTHTLDLATGYRTWSTVTFSLAAAFVIASIVVLFDRALIQSDWFVQSPFGVAQTLRKRFWSFASKVIRVALRIGMAIGLAFVLSTFVELKILESSILTVMQKLHLKENATLYDQVKLRVTALQTETEGQKEIVDQLEDNLQNLISNRSINPNEQKKVVENEIAALRLKIAEAEIKFDQQPNESISALQNQLAVTRENLKANADTIRDFQKRANAEETGNPEKIPGISGIRKCKSRCKYYLKEAKLEQQRQQVIEAEIDMLEQTVALEKSKMAAAKQVQGQVYGDQIHSLTLQLSDLSQAQDSTRLGKLDRDIISVNAELNRRKDDLSAEFSIVNAKIDALYGQLLKNPAFIPFRDGPLDRLAALEQLKAAPSNDLSATRFSLMLKIFIIFLEVVPIMAKLLFSPPSVYAIKLQVQAALVTRDVYASMQIDGLRAEARNQNKEPACSSINGKNLQEVVKDQELAAPYSNVTISQTGQAVA